MKILYFLISLFFFNKTNGYYSLLKKIADKPSRTIFDRLHFLTRKPVNTIKNTIKNTKNQKNEKKRRIRVNSTMNEENRYNLNWYVIGESSEFKKNKIQQVQIWNNKYAVWRENDKQLSAMDNHCSHRGASLSLGELTYTNKEARIVCPYHGYEFNGEGVLCKIPGLNFTNSQCHNQLVYPIFEQDGWVYMNIIPSIYTENVEFYKKVYREPESTNESFSRIQINTDFQAPARIVSENSLDVMHIGFVHTFGNKVNPSPIRETPPFLPNHTNQLHYKTIYDYYSGKDSIAKKIYKFDKLLIENEFILPHTTVARIIFGDLISTVITFALPQNDTHSRLFVKTYRNYWNTKDASYLGDLNNYLGDSFTRYTMEKTVKQDKSVVENIEAKYMDGKYNMMYDKLQNVYRSMYKKYVTKSSIH